MNKLVGQHKFVQANIAGLVQHFDENTEEARSAVANIVGPAATTEAIESVRQKLHQDFSEVKQAIDNETPLPYVHYVSRIDIVGLYQSVLAKVFAAIPELQGYGDKNPIWLTTLVEEAAHNIGAFFQHIRWSQHTQHQPLLTSIVQAWKELNLAKSPYPKGTPKTIALSNDCFVALLADWGGDNPAAKNVATMVRKQNPDIAIHLGDIYYGGTEAECRTFLNNWPTRMLGSGTKPDANFALNGNHEMYSGGEYYFKIVLPAFGQPQPFFCLENDYWRIIGLDTAYNGGRLKPENSNDPLNAQWAWLINLLKNGPKKATIISTHHQPVSAHTAEFGASRSLFQDVEELLATEGVAEDAIFGWFFGHEHRCAIYDDTATRYNARLIGSGCIPHIVQREVQSDPNCTPAKYFNKRGEVSDTDSAVSMYVELRFNNNFLTIIYVDEDGTAWGSEQWRSDEGRLAATPFKPADGIEVSD